MTEQTIIVIMNEIKRVDQMLSVIKNLHGKMDAHFIALYVIPAVQVYPGAAMQMPTQVYDGFQRFYLNHAKELKSKFDKLISAEGIKAEWRQVKSATTSIAEVVTEQSRMCDLVVIPQSRGDDNSSIEPDFSEVVIMQCGRPVLVIPSFGDFKEFGTSVLVAWNGTRESARAVFDAKPFLTGAAKVDVSWLNPDTDGEMDLPGSEIATVLARHGVKVLVEAIPTGGLATGEALLSHASDIGADMLVMGAYGHSRMRELVFGGATRTILASMTVPVLMSH